MKKIVLLLCILSLSYALASAESDIPPEIKAQCRAADNPPECIKALGYKEEAMQGKEFFDEQQEYPHSPEEMAEKKRQEEEFKKRYDQEQGYPEGYSKNKKEQMPAQNEEEIESLKQEIAQIKAEQREQQSQIDRMMGFLKRIFSFSLFKDE